MNGRDVRFPAAAALALGLALLGPGCADTTVGRRFDVGRADEIEAGRSTRTDVQASLGSPLRSVRAGDLTIDVHKYLTPDVLRLVLVSYRDDEVVRVTTRQD